jgi:tRNA modification GTPase
LSNIETIVAIATPLGRGGVGVVRMSGPQSLDFAKKITHKESFAVREAVFTKFYGGDNIIDEGLTIYFKAPHSFTGEEVVEFQSHGSPIAMELIIQKALFFGARLARAGEFSERAFLNNKIDLTQAEAIADLISASSVEAARSATRSLQGEFSKKINTLLEKIIHLRMYVEAAIDFPEEEIDFLSDGRVQKELEQTIASVAETLAAANQGVLLTQGIQVVIAGKPNAGKSSLLNALSGRESAIVTDVPGTTRDVLRESIQIDGVPLHIIDTAGLRHTEDLVEKEGIRRAWNEIEKADVILLLVDESQEKFIESDWQDLLQQGVSKKLIVLHNKIDLLNELPRVDCCDEAAESTNSRSLATDSILKKVIHLYLSIKKNQGLDLLKETLKSLVGYHTGENNCSARRRHVDALTRAQEKLLIGEAQLKDHRAGELLAEDLRQAQLFLSEITGEFSSDDLLGKIFSSFCVGK